MKTVKVLTDSAEDTRKLGEKIGKRAEADMVFLLSGDLGAGKTTLTQGIARGLGIQRNVTSPTFTIQKLYRDGRLELNHIDAYRLEGLNQDLGFEEYISDGGVTVIEWSQFAPQLIPQEYCAITLRLKDGDRREVTLEAHGEAYEKLLKEIA